MQKSLQSSSSESADLNRVIGWFISLRWTACLFVFATLLIVRLKLNFQFPYNILFSLNALLFLINLIFTVYYYRIKVQNLSRKEMSILFNVQVCSDYILLFLVIYFTGFLENPFSYFFVFHIMLTSLLFPPAMVFVYVTSLLAVFILTFFAEYFTVIPHFPFNSTTYDPVSYHESIFMKATGLCSTLVVSAYLITSIKSRVEERGKRIEVELNRYKDLDKTKSNFILQVTHELRGPLAALSGYHEMILKGITGGVNEKTQHTLQKADHRAENLLTIIDEMIDFAYMKSDKAAQYSKVGIKLRDAIGYNLELFSARALQKKIHIVSNCSKDLIVWANRDLLNIILSNLITNAIKYSSTGAIIAVNATLENEEIHLFVKDNGMGIEPEELEKIFEEFYRTRRARKIERDGTGLGLPIVQRAVESLDGKITVYSELGKGSTFHIFLPRHESESLSSGGEDGEQ